MLYDVRSLREKMMNMCILCFFLQLRPDEPSEALVQLLTMAIGRLWELKCC